MTMAANVLARHVPQDMTQVDVKLSSFAQESRHLAPITACLTDTAFPIIAAAAQFIHCGMRPKQAAMRVVAV